MTNKEIILQMLSEMSDEDFVKQLNVGEQYGFDCYLVDAWTCENHTCAECKQIWLNKEGSQK